MFQAIGKGAAGAVLALLVVVGASLYGDLLVPVGTTDAIGPVGLAGASGPAAEERSFAALLAVRDRRRRPEGGEEMRLLPHLRPGGPHRVGPNLAAVVGAAKARKPGFAYSGAVAGLAGLDL
jgi:hypothetical protein